MTLFRTCNTVNVKEDRERLDWKPLDDTDDESDSGIDEEDENNRLVKFCSQPDIREVERVSEEDRSNYWLSVEEFGRIQRNAVLTFSQVTRGQISLDEESFSQRGLEKWNAEDAYQAKGHRMTHAKRVLDELELQAMEGLKKVDWESLRLACIDTSVESADKAIKLAKADEEEAKRAQAVRPKSTQATPAEVTRQKSIWTFETKLEKKKRIIKLCLFRKRR
jgi:hypothetical protein